MADEQRPVWKVILDGVIIVVGLMGVLFAISVFPNAERYDGEGDPEHAREWVRRFEKLDSPQTAKAAFPEDIVSHSWNDKDWIFGIATDSHASPRGGTVVTKDSTGRIRVYFGHVCGPEWLPSVFRYAYSLERIQSNTFVLATELRETTAEFVQFGR